MATLGNISFNIKNEYAASATYLKDDIVHYNGHWHLCTTDTTAGQNPDTHPGSWDSCNQCLTGEELTLMQALQPTKLMTLFRLMCLCI